MVDRKIWVGVQCRDCDNIEYYRREDLIWHIEKNEESFNLCAGCDFKEELRKREEKFEVWKLGYQ